MNGHTNLDANISNMSWFESPDGPLLHTRIIFATIWIFISVVGIIGNSLVIYVAIRFEKLNNFTNCFIVNLAITDIVFLVFCMPLLVVQYTLEHWYFNETFCKLLNFISFVSVLVTVLTLVVMTIDRYIYVVHPFENIRWRKPRTVFLLSLIIWLLSCVLASPFYVHYGITPDTQKQCALLITDENLQKQFPIYTVTVYYFIPLTIIIICYTKLLHYVYSKERKIQAHMKSNTMQWSKKRRAVTRMVAIVTLVFSLCWLPITLYIMLGNVFENKTAGLYYFKIIANSFAYLNSAINPVLYAFLNRSFRNNCGNILSKPTCSLLCQENSNKRQSLSRMKTYNHKTTDEQNHTINNNTPSLLNDEKIDNDFSDAECESPNPACYSHIIHNPLYNQKNHLKQQMKILKTDINTNDGKPLTTSL